MTFSFRSTPLGFKSHHTTPYRITSHHIILVSYHIILHRITSYHITSHSIISCYTVPSSKVMLAYYVKQTVPYFGWNLLKPGNHDAPIVCCGAVCCLKHGRTEEWTCGTRTQNATHRHTSPQSDGADRLDSVIHLFDPIPLKVLRLCILHSTHQRNFNVHFCVANVPRWIAAWDG